MEYTREFFERLIQNPSETLDIELKVWFDPETKSGIAKIAKAAIALRNYDGGCLVIGFTDLGQPDIANAPQNVRKTFHPDVIQRIVAKYASDLFEATVIFVERDGIDFPVISVKSGVRTPVATKLGIKDGNEEIMADNCVYIRSLAANKTVSTTAARWQDWERLTRICFDNREADIGACLSVATSMLRTNDC